MATRASKRSAKRPGGTTRKTRMSGKMGKHAHRGAWIGGLAVAGAATVAAILLLKNKSAAAQPVLPPVNPAGQPLTALQAAAVAMNNAINSSGYRQLDSDVYKSVQTAAGLTVDGFPGQNTYKTLINALASIVPPVVPSSNLNSAYTFKNPPGFDGHSSPTPDQWFSGQTQPAGGWPAMGTTSEPAA